MTYLISSLIIVVAAAVVILTWRRCISAKRHGYGVAISKEPVKSLRLRKRNAKEHVLPWANCIHSDYTPRVPWEEEDGKIVYGKYTPKGLFDQIQLTFQHPLDNRQHVVTVKGHNLAGLMKAIVSLRLSGLTEQHSKLLALKYGNTFPVVFGIRVEEITLE